MSKIGLLISGGIDSRVLRHMKPDYPRIHFSNPDDVYEDDSAIFVDISSYSDKAEGMMAEAQRLKDEQDFTNFCYGYHQKYQELNDVRGWTSEEDKPAEQPLREWYKHDIIRYASENNIDLRDCISCLDVRATVSSGDACGECYQCRQIEVAKQRLDSDGFDYSNVI